MGKKGQFLLLDSRAGILAVEQDCNDLKKLDDDWGRYILVVGNAKWICNQANKGTYGDFCIISNMDGIVLWDWLKENDDKEDSSWHPYGKKN